MKNISYLNENSHINFDSFQRNYLIIVLLNIDELNKDEELRKNNITQVIKNIFAKGETTGVITKRDLDLCFSLYVKALEIMGLEHHV